MSTTARGPSDDIGALGDRLEALGDERSEEAAGRLTELERHVIDVSGTALTFSAGSLVLGTALHSAARAAHYRQHAIAWLDVSDVLSLGKAYGLPKLSKRIRSAPAIDRSSLSSSTFTGRTRKLSVSLPEDLVEEVRERTGEREFSRYVAEALSRQVELDKLAELADELSAEFGSIPEESLAKARAVWPNADEE